MVVEIDRLIDALLADAGDAGADVVAVGDRVRAASPFEILARCVVPTDRCERLVADCIAVLVLATASFLDRDRRLGLCLVDRTLRFLICVAVGKWARLRRDELAFETVLGALLQHLRLCLGERCGAFTDCGTTGHCRVGGGMRAADGEAQDDSHGNDDAQTATHRNSPFTRRLAERRLQRPDGTARAEPHPSGYQPLGAGVKRNRSPRYGRSAELLIDDRFEIFEWLSAFETSSVDEERRCGVEIG